MICVVHCFFYGCAYTFNIQLASILIEHSSTAVKTKSPNQVCVGFFVFVLGWKKNVLFIFIMIVASLG